MLATKTDGTLWSWGRNEIGQLGHNNRTEYHTPHQIGSATNWVAVHTGDPPAAIVVNTDGDLFTWGTNNQGMLGHNQTAGNTNISAPTQIPGRWTNSSGSAEARITQFSQKGDVMFALLYDLG